jgi:hypothetical protein
MARPSLEPNTWGSVAVSENTDKSVKRPWRASARYADPHKGQSVLVRRFGESPEEAEAALLTELHERARRHSEPAPAFGRFGEALEYWWAGRRPATWTESTARSMEYARRRLDEFADSPWPLLSLYPVMREQLSGSRTGELAVRVLDRLVEDLDPASLVERHR